MIVSRFFVVYFLFFCAVPSVSCWVDFVGCFAVCKNSQICKSLVPMISNDITSVWSCFGPSHVPTSPSFIIKCASFDVSLSITGISHAIWHWDWILSIVVPMMDTVILQKYNCTFYANLVLGCCSISGQQVRQWGVRGRLTNSLMRRGNTWILPDLPAICKGCGVCLTLAYTLEYSTVGLIKICHDEINEL